MPFVTPTQVNEDVFGKDGMEKLAQYVLDKVKHIKAKNSGIRDTLLPKWIKTYRGKPKTEEKDWPWKGASNLVVKLAATHCDELLSRVMAIYQTDPLYIAKMLGDLEDGNGEDQREILEIFMTNMAMEPQELDLYRTEEVFFSSAIRYGTGVVKFPWEYIVEQTYVSIGTPSAEEKTNYSTDGTITIKDGPSPQNVPLNRFGVDPRFIKLDKADFMYHIIPKNKWDLDEMKGLPDIYDSTLIEKIETTPDRFGPDETTRELQDSKKVGTEPNEEGAEWDIYECWLTFRHNKKIYRLIAYVHEMSETILGCIFNPYPENITPIEDAKLAYDDESYHGYGLIEMLSSYQEEITNIHNWRMDNRQFATTGVGRVDKNSKLASLLTLFPGVLIPANPGEIEPLQFGQNAVNMGTEDEMLILQLAKDRSGVDPAIGGSGGGTVNKKGQFSAQGTMMTLQQQNNRNNLRMSDMRSAHTRMGRKILTLYAHLGLGSKIQQYGERRELLMQALNNYKNKKLGLVIKPATGSNNKELEKQNDILLSATLERLYAGDAQIIQSLAMPNMPDELKQYYFQVLGAKNSLMRHVLRNFGHDDAARLAPLPSFIKEQRNAQLQNGGAGVNPQASSTAALGAGTLPVGGGQVTSRLPQ